MMPGVPPEVLQEFLRDGTDAQPNDSPDRVFEGKYERLLRDYVVNFDELNRQIASLRDQIAAAKTDEAIAKKLQADAEKEVAARTTLIDNTLKPELAEVKGELALVTSHRDALQAKLDGVNQEIQGTLTENKRLLAEWTALQFAAAKRLNELIDRDTAASAPYTGE
jgi:chromosome segregation ATPase